MCNACLVFVWLASAVMAILIVSLIIRTLRNDIYWSDKEKILCQRQSDTWIPPLRERTTAKEILAHSHREWHYFLNDTPGALLKVLLEAAEKNPRFIYCTSGTITSIFSRPNQGWPAILAEVMAISNARASLDQEPKKKKG